MKRLSIIIGISVLVLLPAVSSAKVVVCINHDPANEDGFLASAEGWARTITEQPPDIISLNGNLTDCLAQVEDGDSLIIIAHARSEGGETNKGYAFLWGKDAAGEENEYTDFGTGPFLMPVPEGFNTRQNVWFKFVSCWSTNDPDGEGEDNDDISLVDKLINAMGGTVNEHQGHGFVDKVITDGNVIFPIPAAMTDAEAAIWEAKVKQVLEDDDSWEDFPPTNRPGSEGGPNQQTEAQRIVNDAADLHPKPTIQINYENPPCNETSRLARSTFVGSCTQDEYCEYPTWKIYAYGGEAEIPTLTEWGMIILGVVLLGAVLWFVRRRYTVATTGL